MAHAATSEPETSPTGSWNDRPTIDVRPGLRANLRLSFEADEITKQTRLTESCQEPPLRVVRAFEHDNGAALVHLHNVSGGLLGGDELSLHAHIRPDSRVQITTTGATRIYRPRKSSLPAVQLNEIAIGKNALLEYVPDQLIPYSGTRFSQRTSIRLADGAGLFWWEILAPGREARGEIFEYESVAMKTDICADGHPIAVENVRLEPRNHALTSLARLGPYRTWATFTICRVGLDLSFWIALEDQLRGVISDLQTKNPSEPPSLWAISTLPAHGVVARCVTMHGREALKGLHALWRAAKLRLYGREPIFPRKLN